jgi:hypothetical protein
MDAALALNVFHGGKSIAGEIGKSEVSRIWRASLAGNYYDDLIGNDSFTKISTEVAMQMDLNHYCQSVELWEAILLLLMFGCFALECVGEVYANDKESQVKNREADLSSR